MLARLILLFILFPLVDMALLLVIAQHTGPLFTIGLIVVTGVVGAWSARRAGIHCLGRIQSQLAQGQMPADSLVDGLLILIAGALLITPGILTDAVGFALLIPPVRARLKRFFSTYFKSRVFVAGVSSGPPRSGDVDDVIDVDHRPANPPGND